MSYVKNNQKGISYTSVNQLIQPQNNGIGVLPPYAAVVQTKMGQQPGIIQPKSTAAAEPKPVIASPKLGINKTGFIDNDDGANIRTGPAEVGGKTLTNQPLPPATRVFVGGQHPESPQWWYVNAYLPNMIVRGYIQNFRITTDLPEPGAKLCQLSKGDTVEKLARREFTSEVRDGHDLRYYENVLLYVNRQAGRDGITGTFQAPNLFGGGSNNIQLMAGKRIWLVSPAFAKQLESIVPSGSFTGGAVAKAGRIYSHIQDIVRSVTDSPQYFLEIAGEYAQVIYEHLPEIIATVAGFIIAESISATLAASPTGVGQLAALLIQLILALLGVQALVESLGQALDHAGKWLQLAWAAEGDPRKLGKASKEFLRTLVSIAIAALSVLGIKGNLGKGLKLSSVIKIEPPGLGMSPAMVTSTGQIVGGGVRLYPGSVTSTGPAELGIYSSMAGSPGKGLSKATKSEAKDSKVKNKQESIKEGLEGAKVVSKIEKILYGSSDLSKIAIEFRKANRIFTVRNVAVFEYTENGVSKTIVMASERGVGHAERLIANRLEQMGIKPSQVKRIFSELEPCSVPGGYCKRLIQNTFPQAKVTYCFEYGETATSRSIGVNSLKQAVQDLSK